MSLRQALDMMLSTHKREVTLIRKGTPDQTYTINVTPSNYGRTIEVSNNVVSHGREFIISRTSLEKASFTLPLKRGDRIVDTELGTSVIDTVIELPDLGGAIMAYRVRCQ